MTSDDGDAGWQPRGLPPLPPPRRGKHHPNFWLGGVFGVLVTWACILIVDPLQAVRIVLPYEPLPLLNDVAIGLGSFLLGMLLMVHALGLRPRVWFDDDILVIDNPLRTWRVPVTQIADVDTTFGYARIRLLNGRRIISWGLELYVAYTPRQISEIREQVHGEQISSLPPLHVTGEALPGLTG